MTLSRLVPIFFLMKVAFLVQVIQSLRVLPPPPLLLVLVPTSALLQTRPSLLPHGHPQMLLILAGPEVAKGRHLHHLRFPPLRGEYVISNLASSSFFSYSRGLPKANPTYILIYLPSLCSFLYFFITSWQSKRKEDTSSTHPILLDKMELEVYPVLLHAFPMSHVTVCSFFVPFFLYIYHHSSFLPLFFFFFFFLGQP